MDIIQIIVSIGGLIGTLSGLYCFLFVRQERERKELENDSQIIEQYKALAASQEGERQRLLNVVERRNAKVRELENERDKYLNLWLNERCVLSNCSYRRPPKSCELPQSIEDTE